MNDADIVKRVHEGDQESYGLLVTRHQNAVYGLAYHHLQNFEDARDVAQEAFIHAYSRLHQLRETEKFAPWLRQITVNQCHILRRRHLRVEPDEDAMFSRHEVEQVETRMALQQALECLSPASRLTIILFYLRSYSLQEIADFLEVPVTTIKSRLRNARARLHKELRHMMEETMANNPLPEDFAVRVIHNIGIRGSGDLLTFSPDGRLLAGIGVYLPHSEEPWHAIDNNWMGEIHVWDVQTGTPLHVLQASQTRQTSNVSFSKDSKLLVCSSHHSGEVAWNGEVQVWDAKSGTLLRAIAVPNCLIRSSALSPEDKAVAGGVQHYNEGQISTSDICLWETQTGNLQQRLSAGKGIIGSMAFSPDGKTLAAGTGSALNVQDEEDGVWNDFNVQLWDVTTGKMRHVWHRPHADHFSTVAFSPDGQSIATGDGPEGDVLIFDVTTYEMRQTLSGHTHRVYDVHFSPDGKRLATASADGTVKLWNAANGELLQTFTEHTSDIRSVAFSADGETMASADADGTIKVWRLEPAQTAVDTAV